MIIIDDLEIVSLLKHKQLAPSLVWLVPAVRQLVAPTNHHDHDVDDDDEDDGDDDDDNHGDVDHNADNCDIVDDNYENIDDDDTSLPFWHTGHRHK